MGVKDFAERLRNFDAYPKTLEDFRIKTFGGAAVTIISGIFMVILFISEFNYYLATDLNQELLVDTTRGQKLRINIDITFPKMSCAFLSVDAMDVSGEQQIDIDHHMFKQRIDPEGKEILEDPPSKETLGDKSEKVVEAVKKPLNPDRCESCYGAENPVIKCCNTCEDVREAYRQKGWAFNTPENIEQCLREGWSEKIKEQENEGCRLYGYLEVNKVAGNFHFAPGKSFSQHHVHVHDMQAFGNKKFNVSHEIRHLSFGTDYPGIINPLDETSQYAEAHDGDMWESLQGGKVKIKLGTPVANMYQYFIKIVPTTYAKLGGEVLYTNQYSVTKHQKVITNGLLGEQGLPGVFFMYELSPMMVKYTEKQRSFMHFLTGVCAIIGGVFTVAGLIDALIYHSANVIQKKIELGKVS